MSTICMISILIAMTTPILGQTGIRYRAAVVELTPNQASSIQTKAAAQRVELQNVAMADVWVEKAASKGVQIIVFSEDYADSGWNLSSAEAHLYAEPLPQPGPASLCINDSPTPVASALACSAKKHNIHIISGIADFGPCVKHLSPFTHKPYPCDTTTNRTWFNSMVAFGPDGALLAKYHKGHLARGWDIEYEPQWAEAEIPEVVTFESSFGVKFGMFICNDINFGGPTRSLLKAGVRDFIFSTFWINSIPQFSAVGTQDSFSRAHGVNFIAANADYQGRLTSGSGIWPANTSAPFVQNFNPTQKKSDGWMGIVDLISPSEAQPLPPPMEHPAGSPSVYENWNFSFFSPVPGHTMQISTSAENISCHLDVKVSSGGGSYALYAGAGLCTGGWYTASCVVVACVTPDVEGCWVMPTGSLPGGGAVFSELTLRVNATKANTFWHSALCGNAEVVTPRSSLSLAKVGEERVLSLSTDCPLLTAYVDAHAQAEDEAPEGPPGGNPEHENCLMGDCLIGPWAKPSKIDTI